MVRKTTGNWRMGKLRAHRKQAYTTRGFLAAEAELFSKLPLNIPYTKSLRKDREREFQRALKQGISKTRYTAAIRLKYSTMGWHKEGTRFSEGDIWRMLKYYEAEYIKTADPNDQYLLHMRKHHGHKELLDRGKVLEQKRRYNALPSTKLKKAEYRKTHKEQIAESRRKLKAFKKGQI